MDRLPNIRQIAEQAGVSVTTVSRVLNEHPYVSEAKKKAVLEAVAKLNYVPNSNAVQLIKGKTSAIGVTLPHIYNPYLNACIEGILQEARLSDYKVLFCQTNYDSKEEIRYLDMLRNKQVDGFILSSRSASGEEIVPYLSYGPVILCEDPGDGPFAAVYSDHFGSFKAALEYLIKKGHTQIGCCLGRKHSRNTEIRKSAMQDVLQSFKGLTVREEWIFYDTLSFESGIRTVEQLAQLEERPTAMIAVSHQTAAGMMMESAKHCIRIPEDLAIISMDGHPLGTVLQITSVDQPVEELGRQAFRMLLKQLANKGENPERLELTHRLIERSTV